MPICLIYKPTPKVVASKCKRANFFDDFRTPFNSKIVDILVYENLESQR